MKKILILLLSMLCISCSGGRLIVHPQFVNRNTTKLEVGKIVLDDTSTVLHIYAKYTPNNPIQIDKEAYIVDNKGKRYIVSSGIGITPGEAFHMPESGETEFQLLFPPLDKGVSSISLSDADHVKNGFKIWGIQLKGGHPNMSKLPKLKLPRGLKPSKEMYTDALPESELKFGESVIQGKVMDYLPDMGDKLRILIKGCINNQSKIIYADVSPDGSFEAHFNLYSPSLISLGIAGSITWIVAEPDKTTNIYINLREIARRESKYHADGPSFGELFYTDSPWAVVSEEYYKYRLEMTASRNSMSVLDRKTLAVMSPEAYKDFCLDIQEKVQENIDTLPVCRATRDILTFDNRMATFTKLYMAPSEMVSARYGEGLLVLEQFADEHQKILDELPDDYIGMSYFDEICDSRFLPFVSSTQPLFAQRVMDRQGITVSDYPFISSSAEAVLIMANISQLIPLNSEQIAQIKTLPPAYSNALTDANDELLAQLEVDRNEEGYTINEVGDVPDRKLFESIISRYQGKVILVDFWGPGCYWCKLGHEEMAPVKEELKDVVYVYIVDENFPEVSWKNMIVDISGEHYRLTEDQWNYLGKKFGFHGAVPSYVIVDRNGEVKYNVTGYPGAGVLKEELIKNL